MKLPATSTTSTSLLLTPSLSFFTTLTQAASRPINEDSKPHTSTSLTARQLPQEHVEYWPIYSEDDWRAILSLFDINFSNGGQDEQNEEDLPEWKQDYYAALDEMDDDLAKRNILHTAPDTHRLFKRKGGGAAGGAAAGGRGVASGGRGGGSNGGKKDSGKKDGGKTDSGKNSDKKNSKSGSGTAGSKPASQNSNAGGYSNGRSGPPPPYGSGDHRYYSGGGSAPYTAGNRSPGGLSSFSTPLAFLGGMFAGAAVQEILTYPWHNPLTYHNPSDAQPMVIPYQNTTSNGQNSETLVVPPGEELSLPVKCICEENLPCGCDETHDEAYTKGVLEDLAKNGNSGDTAQVGMVNGTLTLVVNGTLPNGTTADSRIKRSTNDCGRLGGMSSWSVWITGVVVGAVMVGLV